MLKPDLIRVAFSAEYGDKSLPSIKELATEKPDENKAIILDYLKMNMILACPGVVYDILDPNCIIGSGHQFTDGKHIWSDYLSTYIRKYNIPIPQEFKEYILKHYKERKRRHLLFKCVDHIKIMNQPRFNRQYDVHIYRNGNILYLDRAKYPEILRFSIKPANASFIINPATEQLFCYDEDNHGEPMIDAYHWEIEFYTKKGLCHKTEGWPSENIWRLQEFIMILKIAERHISQSLGSAHLKRNLK